MPTQFVSSADGTRIAYDSTGHGPALMLLHGAGKTRKDWHKVGYVERLKQEFTVITVDSRGVGESDPLYEIADYAIERIGEDVVAVADTCEVQEFAVWGYSYGGTIARYLGARLDRVSAIAAIGVAFGPAVDEEFGRYIDEFVEKWEPLARGYREGTATVKGRELILKQQIPTWVACLQAMRDWPSIEPADMRCPAMLLVGTRNTRVANWVKSNREALDKANVHIEMINGLTHQYEFSQIDQVFPAVHSFLKSQMG